PGSFRIAPAQAISPTAGACVQPKAIGRPGSRDDHPSRQNREFSADLGRRAVSGREVRPPTATITSHKGYYVGRGLPVYRAVRLRLGADCIIRRRILRVGGWLGAEETFSRQNGFADFLGNILVVHE